MSFASAARRFTSAGVISTLLAMTVPARAVEIEAVVQRLGVACKNEVARVYPSASMADIQIELGATEREGINSGSITTKDIKNNGLSYNWTVSKNGKQKHYGSCGANYAGAITDMTPVK